MSFDWRHDTGPINLLPADDEFWTEQPRTPDGRWAPMEKPLEYAGLVREPTVRIAQWEQVPLDALSITYVEGHANHVSIQRDKLIDGSTRLTYSDGTRSLILPDKTVLRAGDPGFKERVNLSTERAPLPSQRKAVTPAAIRKWAQANGYLVGDKGKLPQMVIDAYHKANG